MSSVNLIQVALQSWSGTEVGLGGQGINGTSTSDLNSGREIVSVHLTTKGSLVNDSR